MRLPDWEEEVRSGGGYDACVIDRGRDQPGCVVENVNKEGSTPAGGESTEACVDVAGPVVGRSEVCCGRVNELHQVLEVQSSG